ncbi:MAG: outer membrane protein TolC [Sphingomonas echinoides]|jgi:outer membrane protein TolC
MTLSTFAASLILAPVSGLSAQERMPAPAADVITLGEALDYADSNYPAIKAALNERLSAARQIDVARTAYLPQINLLAQINRATANNITGVLLPQSTLPAISGPVLPESGRSDWNSAAGVLASWRVFDAGQRAARVDAERQNAAAADADLNLTRLEVARATLGAYLNTLASSALVAAAQANVDRLQTFSNAVHVLVANQLRPGVEAQQADAALALGQTRLISAQADLESQKATLARLLGRSVDGLRLSSPAIPSVPDSLISPAQYAKDHPAAIAEQARVNRERARLSAISRSYAPSVDALASAYTRGSGRDANGTYSGGTSGLTPNTSNWALGLQITLPLGSYPTIRAQEQAQRASLGAERDRYDETLRLITERQQQTRAALVAAIAIARITPAELQAAQTAEVQQRARFQSGLASAVDVTVAEAALAQAEAQEAIAKLNVWRALGDYAVAMGDLAPVRTALADQ